MHFFRRNVLRASILAMLRFQSVVTVSLLNKITTQSVCVFFSIEQTKSNAQVCFFLFYRHSMEIRKVVILDLKSRSTFVFGYTLTRCKLLFFLVWMRSFK